MEYQNQNQNQDFIPTQNTLNKDENDGFFNKNFLIMILLFLLIFSFLGINILILLGNTFQSLFDLFTPLISKILSLLGYTTGTIINTSADVVGDTAKTGIDIAQGSVTTVGDIIKDISNPELDPNAKRSIDNAIHISPIPLHPPKQPEPAPSEHPIQKPISASKSSWCLVGEYQQKRGCIEIGEHDKCLSGQVYPSQKLCLNPTLTQNA